MNKQVKARELNYKTWPGNEFDMNDKELFQVHEKLCDDLEVGKNKESDIVKISVGIWAGLRFAQIANQKLSEVVRERDFYKEITASHIEGNNNFLTKLKQKDAEIAKLKEALKIAREKYAGTIYMRMYNPEVLKRYDDEIDKALGGGE